MEFRHQGRLIATYGDIVREMAKALALAQTDHEAGAQYAREFKEAYVAELLADIERDPRVTGVSRAGVEAIARDNLGYLTGEFADDEFRLACELFGVVHPIFGTTPVSAEEAFRRGIEWAERSSHTQT